MLTIAVFALLTACGAKDPKKEAAKYESNLKIAKQATAVNAPFSKALNAEIARAEEAMKATASITEPEAKAKAIRSASSILSGGLFAKLKDTKSKISKIKELSLKLTGKGESYTDLAKAKAISEQAREVTSSTEAILKAGSEDANVALAVLKEKTVELDAVIRTLNDILSASDNKSTHSSTSTSFNTSSPKTVTTNTKVTVKTSSTTEWACSYCKGMNKQGTLKCKGCGAPKAAPKKK